MNEPPDHDKSPGTEDKSTEDKSTEPHNSHSDEKHHDHLPAKDLELGATENSEALQKENVSSADVDSAVDPNIVDWDGPNDPMNPMNWPGWKIKVHIFLISAITFLTPLGSSILAPGVPELVKDFHSTNIYLASLVVTVYLLGFAAGPLVLAPLSELYGRLIVYHICNILFLVFTVACAVASSMNMEIGFRFLAGAAGSAPLALGGGTIADLIPQEKRGAALAIYALGPVLGPVLAPVMGGFLTQSEGWRWLFWFLSIVLGVIILVSLVLMRETYAVTLIGRKTIAQRKFTGNMKLRSKYDRGLTPRQLWHVSIIRPIKMLIFSPIVLLLSLFMAVIYGYLYLLFTTFTEVFGRQYHFSTGITGLAYLGIGVGNVIGLMFTGIALDRLLKSKSASGEMKPEYRLPPMVWVAPFMPVGLFIYGWTADKNVHWIVPIIGTMFFGFGLITTFMSVQTYIVDAFTIYAASGLAANTLLRSAVGAVLPLAGPKMYQTLGLGWGNSLLAFIALAMCPIPWVFYHYGERIRKSSTIVF